MLSPKTQEMLQKLRNKSGYDTLEKREKLIVSIGGLVLLVLLLFHFILSPVLASRKRLQRSIVDKQIELQKIAGLKKEYEEVASQVGDIADRIEKRPADFTLFSFLEKQATASEVKERVKYMKPSTEEGEGPLLNSVVEMKLEQVTLVQLVEFLKLVESTDDVVSIGRISIQDSGKEEGLLDVIVQIVTFIKKA